MKKRITKIWGIGLAVVLLVSMFAVAVPVSANDQAWGDESIPSATGKVINAGSDVTDIAVAYDGTTIYIIDNENGAGLISTNGGSTWSTMTLHADNDDPEAIAVAPDDEDIIAIIDGTTDEVFVSINGGSSFSNIGVPQQTGLGAASDLTDVAISPADSGIHYIAVSGTEGDGLPNVWYFNLEGTPDLWKETTAGDVALGEANTDTDVAVAVAFSPNFPSDKVMVVITEQDDGAAGAAMDYVRLEYFSFAGKKWGTLANLPSAKTIVSEDGITGINKADVALSPDFLGQDESTYRSFVGLDIAGDDEAAEIKSGLFRVTSSVKALKQNTNTTDEDPVRIHSVSYDGTNLVAGVADTNQVYRSDNPAASTPDVYTATTNKRPGGTDDADSVVVRFAGSNVVAGTSGDMSAFSVSTDLGKTFNDISMVDVDTDNDVITGVAMNADASVIYLAIEDPAGVSIWRKASAWQRVLALSGAEDLIIELAPDDADSLYVAAIDTEDMWVSQNGGLTKWFTRSAPADIADIAVESADTMYILAIDDSVYKSTNTGFTYGSAKDSDMGGSAHSLTSLGEDLLVAGSEDGEISFSKDGGSTWTDYLKEDLSSEGGNVVATATGLDTGDFIFAATDTDGAAIYRWEIGQTSSKWKVIADLDAIDGETYGLALHNGVLYAVVTDGTDSWLYRSLNPTATTPTFDDEPSLIEDEVFDTCPNNIWVSTGSTGSAVIWAISGDELYSYTDSTVGVGPTLTAPKNAGKISVNPVTGGSYDITFIWSRLAKATKYKIEVATDSAFTEKVIYEDNYVTSSSSTVAQVIGPNASNDDWNFNFLPGKTYYWRVRVTEPAYSPWSDVQSFTIESLAPSVPAILSPVNGTTGVNRMASFSWSPLSGTATYKVVVADNPGLTAPIADATVTTTAYAVTTALEYGKTYYWAVKALTPVEGDWSAVSNFTVMAETAVTPEPPVTITNVPAPTITVTMPAITPPADIVIQQPAATADAYIWAIIIIGAILVIAVIVLIVRTRRQV